MNPPKCDDPHYIHPLSVEQTVFNCTQAAQCQPASPHPPAHDGFSRLLQRQPSNTETLWQEVQRSGEQTDGLCGDCP